MSTPIYERAVPYTLSGGTLIYNRVIPSIFPTETVIPDTDEDVEYFMACIRSCERKRVISSFSRVFSIFTDCHNPLSVNLLSRENNSPTLSESFLIKMFSLSRAIVTLILASSPVSLSDNTNPLSNPLSIIPRPTFLNSMDGTVYETLLKELIKMFNEIVYKVKECGKIFLADEGTGDMVIWPASEETLPNGMRYIRRYPISS